MRAAVAVVLRDRETIFLVLQLLEEFQAALARQARLAQIARTRKVGGAFLRAGKGEIFAHRRLLAHAQNAHARFRAARRNRSGAQDQAEQGDAGRGLHAFR